MIVAKKRRKKRQPDTAGKRRPWLGCMVGCLAVFVILIILLVVGVYVIFRPVHEPSPATLIPPETRAVFVLNADTSSKAFRTLAWNITRAYYDARDETIEKEQFDQACEVLNFFIYPKILVMVTQERVSSPLVTSMLINFRRASMLFRYFLPRGVQNQDFPGLNNDNEPAPITIVEHTWVITENAATLNSISTTLQRKEPAASTSREMNEFLVSFFQIESPDLSLIGFIDNSTGWISRALASVDKAGTPAERSTVFTEIFSMEPWHKIPFQSLEHITARGELITSEKASVSLECTFNNASIATAAEAVCERDLLPTFKELLADDFVITYSTDTRNNVLIIQLEIQQTASFMDTLFVTEDAG